MIDIAIAGTAMCPVCASRTGSATQKVSHHSYNLARPSIIHKLSAVFRLHQHHLGNIDVPTPMTTRNAVQNRPKSTIALPELSMKSSGFEHLPHIQLGSGARTYVATTSRGRYCFHKAQERMTRRKPMARIFNIFVSTFRKESFLKVTYERESNYGLQASGHRCCWGRGMPRGSRMRWAR